jgi:hypothetical protein
LLRGSGLQGLSGMSAIRPLEKETRRREDAETGRRKGEKTEKVDVFHLESNNFNEFNDFNLESDNDQSKIQNPKSKIQLVRPLLNWARRIDTENFCRRNEIEYRNDAMNENLIYSRVRVRKILLPMLEEFNPKIIETLSETAKVLRLENEFLEMERRKFEAEKGVEFSDGTKRNLEVKTLKNLPKALLYRALRSWLEGSRGDLRGLDLKHIEAVEGLMLSRKSGKFVELPNGEKIIKKDGKLSFKKLEVVN